MLREADGDAYYEVAWLRLPLPLPAAGAVVLAFSYTPGEVEDSRLLEDHRRWHPGSQHLGSRRQGTSSLPEGTHTLAEAASIPVRAPCTPAPAPGSKQQYRRNIDWRAVPPPLASVAAAAVVVVVVGTAGHQGSTWARNREVEEHSWPVAVVVAVSNTDRQRDSCGRRV